MRYDDGKFPTAQYFLVLMSYTEMSIHYAAIGKGSTK